MTKHTWNLGDIETMVNGGYVTKPIPDQENILTIDQLLLLKSAKLLKSINDKLTFFTIVVVVGICLSFLESLLR